MDCKYFRIGRVPIAITDYNEAISYINSFIANCGKGYVCVSNMRTVTLANKEDSYYELMEKSILNVPDGTPLVWCGRWWGRNDVQRVCGPLLFEKMLADKSFGFRHFFLGDTDETLKSLSQRSIEKDGANVMGSFSPPFKPLDEYDLNTIAKKINDSGANVVWTSLRAPKQDYLGQKLVPLLNPGIVIIGVGAAFRTYLGQYKAPDGTLQKMGLAGLGMMRSNSVWKELKWYFKHSIVLLKYFISIQWRKLRGIKCYEL